ncbi:hypothetical protein FHX82_004368 [Amycolatopsis bartoniae]|uniref:Uncharacterized protein n=1 Tax=Amycolatopsis bartoniae TaxID=941986 RepID=A0A8H9IYE7_9PSEU|nr:hypothetical protein [Amycolatopsis bartoniae]MBB2937295.1 hypothetical protein [Amycolatopsis bartoniae]TVT07935.1 hypothetical protein FNH07_14415 [Amycolatopsis bartoniae]GHF77951.1 hypothetical protein GCM10017566_60270 [Amycolatopsis bartoniae]
MVALFLWAAVIVAVQDHPIGPQLGEVVDRLPQAPLTVVLLRLLTHQHLNSASVPLLWVPDAVAWCYGAGGDWRRRVMPIVSKVIEV